MSLPLPLPEVTISKAFSDIDQASVTSSDANKFEMETDKYGFVGGKEYTDPEKEIISVEKTRKSEIKWLEMLDSWDKWMGKKFSKVKKRCRKGIPSSLRGRAWQLLSGSKGFQQQNKGVFQDLLKGDINPQVVEDIDKDLDRQFPFHEMFAKKGGNGQQDLRDVLHAYAVYNPGDGYCQAQAPIAAVLLMHMPAEEAFWCMVAMFDYYIPGYFSPGLEAVQLDGDVMQGLLRYTSPAAHAHLEELGVSPMLYCTEWFMCIFSRTLPWPCMLRLWDMFFCEGIKVIFRCGLYILKKALGKPEILRQLSGMYETLEYLKKFDLKEMDPELLVHQIVELKVSEEDLELEHKKQLKLRRQRNPQAKSVSRNYKQSPTSPHRGSVVSFNGNFAILKSKKKLSTVSVNTPLIIEQTLEYEKIKKKEKSKTAPAKYRKGLSPFNLVDGNRRHSDTFVIQQRTAGLPKLVSLSSATSSVSIPYDID